MTPANRAKLSFLSPANRVDGRSSYFGPSSVRNSSHIQPIPLNTISPLIQQSNNLNKRSEKTDHQDKEMLNIIDSEETDLFLTELNSKNAVTKNYGPYKSTRFGSEQMGFRVNDFLFYACQEFTLEDDDYFIKTDVSSFLNEIYLMTKNGYLYKLQKGLIEFQLLRIQLPSEIFVYDITHNQYEVFLLTIPRRLAGKLESRPFMASAIFGGLIRGEEEARPRSDFSKVQEDHFPDHLEKSRFTKNERILELPHSPRSSL
jgi:hypothetical protein